jgi:flavoprotein
MPEFIRDGIVKTRKPHKCHGCLEVIPKGTKVYSQTCVEDDRIYTIYMCDACLEYCGNCTKCLDYGEAYEGYVRECRMRNERRER